MATLADDTAPVTSGAQVALYEGVVRRLDSGVPVVDLDVGGSVGAVETSLTVAAGDWVLVAVGRRRTWIVEVQAP